MSTGLRDANLNQHTATGQSGIAVARTFPLDQPRPSSTRLEGVIFEDWRERQLAVVERALAVWLPFDAPAGLGDAMRYCVLDGGKRLRPLLALAAGHAVGAPPRVVLRVACAVELIHAYSLVHDDMPCMDNDVLRRGKPTAHVKFGEATAMLVGDALQSLAFEVLTSDGGVPVRLQGGLCQMLALAAGGVGMVGGQAIDMASVNVPLDAVTLRDMHRRKTGALLKACVTMGAACGSADDRAIEELVQFGDAIGLAFQIVDDVLDATQLAASLGKTAGKDREQNKATYVSVLGLDAARRAASDLGAEAQQALARSGLVNVAWLSRLAVAIVNRDR